jgi:hypothetical protein
MAALSLATLTLTIGLATGATPARAAAAADPVVLIGVSGLRWADLSRAGTPTLWAMADSDDAGSMSTRTVSARTCPLDAWLTISAGSRALSGPPGERSVLNPGQRDTPAEGPCPQVPPVRAGAVSGWSALVALQRPRDGAYGTLGTLGSRIAAAGGCAGAIGPGAAVALAGLDGAAPADRPGSLGELSREVLAATLTACPVTVIDAGALPAPASARAQALTRLDGEVGRILDAAGRRTVIVSGIADPADRQPSLLVLLRRAPDDGTTSWLTSASTRRSGIAQLTDLSAMLARAGGGSFDEMDGRPLAEAGARPPDAAAARAAGIGQARLVTVLPREGAAILTSLAGLAVLAALLGAAGRVLALRRRRPARGWTYLAVAGLLFLSALPIATYLTTPTRWWQRDQAVTVLGLGIAGAALAVTALALLPPRRLGRYVAVVSGSTFVVLSVDAVTGTPLQVGSPLGSGLVYGGRYFGWGNVTFAVYATSALLLAAVLVDGLDRGDSAASRRRALAAVGILGVLVVVAVGWPTFGADVGGVLALAPGFALLALLTAGARVTPARLIAALAAGAIVLGALTGLDRLRPPAERTHLGSFTDRFLSGDAGPVLTGKAAALAASLSTPLGWAEVAALVVLVVLVRRPPAALASLFHAWPSLRHSLAATLLTGGLGTLVNDSGALVAGLAVVLTLPVVVATWLGRAAATADAVE